MTAAEKRLAYLESQLQHTVYQTYGFEQGLMHQQQHDMLAFWTVADTITTVRRGILDHSGHLPVMQS